MLTAIIFARVPAGRAALNGTGWSSPVVAIVPLMLLLWLVCLGAVTRTVYRARETPAFSVGLAVRSLGAYCGGLAAYAVVFVALNMIGWLPWPRG